MNLLLLFYCTQFQLIHNKETSICLTECTNPRKQFINIFAYKLIDPKVVKLPSLGNSASFCDSKMA